MRIVRCIFMSINLKVIYLSFIGPLFEYKDIIWDNIQDYLNEKLENVQVDSYLWYKLIIKKRIVRRNRMGVIRKT